VVGPEAPLVAGLADRFTEAGLPIFGPSAAASAIEGSKAFAKQLMAEHGIPTARFRTFEDPSTARSYCRDVGAPVVVKASGLAAGKGVVVCRTMEEAERAVGECMERRVFGAAGATLVIEELLVGEEVSFFALANGVDAVPLAAAQDHKTVFDDDRGPNTGGMGAYSPVPGFDAAAEKGVMETIVRPTITALARVGRPYRGVLFVGLMMTEDGPKVLEFNCRLGDPECQAILARSSADLVPSLVAAGRASERRIAAVLRRRGLRHPGLWRVPGRLSHRGADRGHRGGRDGPGCPRLSRGHRAARRSARDRGRSGARGHGGRARHPRGD